MKTTLPSLNFLLDILLEQLQLQINKDSKNRIEITLLTNSRKSILPAWFSRTHYSIPIFDNSSFSLLLLLF